MSNVLQETASDTQVLEPWVRWWLPEEEWDRHPSVDETFLSSSGTPDLVENLFHDPMPGLDHLSRWKEEPFLILLGRPGSGKSAELRRAGLEGWLGEPSEYVDANEIASGDVEASLERRSRSFEGEPVRLMIDGLDEALLANKSFLAQVRGWLHSRPKINGGPDVRVAISCRWADWPRSQVQDLASLWPAAKLIALVLCPLRQEDAVATLRRRLGEEKTEDFWRQLQRHHLKLLACWPQTFLAMVNSFARSGKVAQFYAEAIGREIDHNSRLADSSDELLRWTASTSDAEWRQRVAGRLAALMVFTGRRAFRTTAGPAATNDAITSADLALAPEVWENDHRMITLADADSLREQTRLLRRVSAAGEVPRFVFAHQIYQEWLAARWLTDQKLTIVQSRQLFGLERDGVWRVFPVLSSVAAWVAWWDDGFRELLRDQDPLVLQRLDAAVLPEEERAAIVEALLRRTAQIGIVDAGERHALWPSLRYTGVSEDLARWLRDPNAHEAAKELALDMAEGMLLTDLAPVLWEIYPSASERSRSDIASALHSLGHDGSDEKWRAVLRKEVPVDADGTLLGAALEIMVPDKVPLGDVIALVVPERHFAVWGTYSMVIRGMKDLVSVADLPAVLPHLGANAQPHGDDASRELGNTCLKLAMANLEAPGVQGALCTYWYACLDRHVHPHHAYNQEWDAVDLGLEDDNHRRRIIFALVAHRGFERFQGKNWFQADEFLLLPHDLEWALDHMIEADPQFEWRFALAASRLIWGTDERRAVGEKLQYAWSTSATLKGLLPVAEIGETIETALSRIEKANRLERDRRTKAWALRSERRRAAAEKRLSNYTQQCQQAHSAGLLVWPDVLSLLVFRKHGLDGGSVGFEAIKGIGDHEVWMREAARRYLIELPQESEPTSDTSLTALLALGVWVEALDQAGPLQDAVKAHWLPLFMRTLCTTHVGDLPEGISNGRFAALFPGEFPRAFEEFVATQYLAKSSLSELRGFLQYWNSAMSVRLANVLSQVALQPEGFASGLRILAEVSAESAFSVGTHWLAPEHYPPDEAQQAALLGACAFFLQGRLWGEVKQFLTTTGRLRAAALAAGRSLWLREEVEFDPWPAMVLQEVAEALYEAFPKLDGHRGRGFQRLATEDTVLELRNKIAAAARRKGHAPKVPDRCAEDSEDEAGARLRYVAWSHHEAQASRLSREWQPLEPAEVLEFLARPSARLARDADELMGAVIESLRDYEGDLGNGRWTNLWDLGPKKVRSEKHLARDLRDWLRDRLNIFGSVEAELRIGKRTDLLLQVSPRHPGAKPLSLVIEVKKVRMGNKREIQTAMETQLLPYLQSEAAAEGWTHGLYVVMWTPKPGSTEETPAGIEVARTQLAQQAAALTRTDPSFVLRSCVIDARYRG